MEIYLLSKYDEEDLRRQPASYLVEEILNGDAPKPFSSLEAAQRAALLEVEEGGLDAEGLYWYQDGAAWAMEAGDDTYLVVAVTLDAR